ncbi:RNA polymerase sigma factor SigJ [Diaminobutyricibacter sp. McL0618]|uniref:RNA polymerase sigma factor SigJ n=1 Tax=Leifsonia sp. McL0618 TaxID=3415677 RepID=UPI003CE8C603
MDENEWLATRFEEHRGHLRAVAYRMLGSLSDADDAVQDTWLRLSNADTDEVENLGGWLTTVVARICLNMLRARNTRREESLDTRVPDPVIWRGAGSGGFDPFDPESEAVLADSVSLALLVVLDTLTPAERLVFVLHDLFGLPFDEIAPMVSRTPAAARQLASRARRRVKGAAVPAPHEDRRRQQQVVDAFFAAAREGDFDALVAVLHPDVTLRIDAGTASPAASMVVRGAADVARQTSEGLTSSLARAGTEVQPAVVNGGAGVIVTMAGRAVTVMGFTVASGRIVEIDSIFDPARIERILSLRGAEDHTGGDVLG